METKKLSPPAPEGSAAKMKTLDNVHINQAIKTPQFYQLWIVLCFNVSAGIGVIGVAKTMMSKNCKTAQWHWVG